MLLQTALAPQVPVYTEHHNKMPDLFQRLEAESAGNRGICPQRNVRKCHARDVPSPDCRVPV